MASLNPATSNTQYSTNATTVGNLATALTNAQNALQYVTVTYKYYDGSVAKTLSAANGEVLIGTTAAVLATNAPANSSISFADDSTHYTYSWPAFANVTDSAVYQETRGTESHTFTDYVSDNNATCKKDGTKTATCDKCTATNTVTDVGSKDRVEHTPGAAATCTSPQTCTVCGEVLTPVADHTPGVAATCTTAQTCTVCGEVLVAALGHNFSGAVKANPDYTHSFKCTDCDAYGTGTRANGDAKEGGTVACADYYGDTYINVEGGENGKHKQQCSVCQQYSAEVEHTWDNGSIQKDSTCTELGEKLYTCTASGCGATYVSPIDYKAHVWTEKAGDVKTKGTCTTEAVYYYNCANCTTHADDTVANGTYIGEKDATNHTGEANVVKGAIAKTCTTDGYTGDTHWSCCDAIAAQGETIPAGHEWGAWAQYNNGSTHRRTCSVCDTFEEGNHSYTKDPQPVTMPGSTGHYHNYKCELCESRGVMMNGTTPQQNIGTVCYQGAEATYTEKDGSVHTVACVCGNTKEEGHKWTVTSQSTPTCTTPGSKTSECDCCDAVKTETLPAAHTPGEAVEEDRVEATCTADGSYEAVVYCTVCNTELSRKTETVPATGHKFGEIVEANAATCIANGNEAYKQCETCSKFFAADADVMSTEENDSADAFKTDVDSANHENTTVHAETPATCLAIGYTAGTYCDDCKTWISGHEEIPAIAHKNKVHHEKVPATCVAEGTIEYWSCSDCNKNFSDEACTTEVTDIIIKMLDHSYTGEIKSDGNGKDETHSFKCVNGCNGYGGAVAHTWDAGVENPKADCETAGTMTYTCTAEGCGATYTESVNPDGHDYGEWIEEVPATCVATGTKGHYECSVCHKYFAEDKTTVIDNLTIAIDANNHTNLIKTDAVANTCEDDGNIDYWTCEGCGKIYSDVAATTEITEDDTVVAAKGHNYGDWTYVSDGQHKRVCANDSSHVETEACADADDDNDCNCDKCGELVKHTPATAVKEEIKDATCGKAGSYNSVVYCSVCKEKLSSTVEVIPATGAHKYGAFTHVDGTSTHAKTCSVCGGVVTENCTAGDWVIDKTATCIEKGSQYKTCTVCAHEMQREDIPMIAHKFGGDAVNKEDGKHHYACQNLLDAAGTKCGTYGAEEECSGGTATCTEKAVCAKCGEEYGSVLDHDFAKETATADYLKTAATCNDAAVYYKSCSRCDLTSKDAEGEATFVSGEALGHSYDLTSGTNNNDGTHTVSCTVCTEDTEGHTYVVDCTYGAGVVTAPTCTNNGYTTHTCTVCSYSYTDSETTATGHTFGDWTVNADGKTHSRECTACTNEPNRVETADCTYGEWVETKAPTCTEKGKKEHTCTVCKNIVEEDVPALDHIDEDGNGYCDRTNCGALICDHVGQETVLKNDEEPTCLDEGYTGDKHCAKCDIIVEYGTKIPATDHAWADTTYNFAADGKSCTAERVCKNDAEHVETATATITSEVKTPATCEGVGTTTYTATFTETWATEQKLDVQDIAAINHDWADTTYNFAADGKSCTAQRVCNNDAAHVENATATIASAVKEKATCTEMGTTTYTATFDVDWAATQTKDVEDIAAINHAWADTTYSFAADGKSCTAQRVCNNDAAHVENATATIASAVKEKATCTEMGTTTYTATFDVDWAATQTKDVEDIAAINHAWADTTYSFAADGKSCTAQRVCNNDAAHVENATATIASAVKEKATCTEMGTTTYTATFDVDWAATQTKDVEDIAAINHAWAETTYNFAEDGSSCTAQRVCKNDAEHVGTATATITSEVKEKATCTEMGTTTYTATFDVDWAATQTKDVQDIAAINHNWADTTYSFAADGKSCTAERVCKNDASHVETATATITSEVKTPATCEGVGTTTYTATFTETWATEQKLDVQDIAAINHDWDETKSEANLTRPVQNADGTWTDGCYTYTCKNDAKHTTTETVKRADYTDYDSAVKNLEDLLKTDITDEAKAEINKALEDNKLADNLIETEKATVVDPATDALVKIFDAYKGSLKTYTVKFIAEGTVVNEQTVISGNNATAPADPAKDFDSTNHYTFSNWDKSFTNVTSDLEVNAVFAAIAHTMGDWEVTLKASCVATGSKRQDCSACDYFVTETIAKRSHVFVDTTVEKEATCKETGIMNQECSNTVTAEYEACDATTTRVIPVDPNAHKWETEYTVDKKASCDAAGSKSYHCEYCDVINADSVVEIAKREHNLVDTTVAEKATCSATGTMNQKCTHEGDAEYEACTYTTTRVIPVDSDAHEGTANVTKNDKAATCTEEGYTGDLHWSCCDALETKGTVIPVDADAHTGTANVTKNDKAATCTEEGYTGDLHWSCCDALETKGTAIPVDADAHTGTANVTKNYKAATCTEEGYTGDLHWSCCDALETKGTAISVNADAHTGTANVTKNDKAATCTEEGYTGDLHWSCCDALETKGTAIPVDADAHTGTANVTKNDKAATCTEEGYTGDLHWSCCDALETKGTAIPVDADAHTGTANVTKNYKAATCTEEGYTGDLHWSCCDALETKGTAISVNADAHTGTANVTKNYKAATCTEEGYTGDIYWSCCDALETKGTVIPVDADAHAGTANVTKNYKAATCTEEGYTGDIHWSCCDALETKGTAIPVDPNAHKAEADYTVIKKATCDADGYKAILCEYCDAELSKETIAKREHNLIDVAQTAAPTCTTPGIMSQRCDNVGTDEYEACTYTATREIAIDANAHDWNNWSVTTPATCVDEGERTRVCKNDSNHVERESIAINKNNHAGLVKVGAKAAACEEIGWDAYEYCTECDYTTYVEIPALEHDYEGVVTKEETCTEDGIITYTCKNDATHTYIEVIPAHHTDADDNGYCDDCNELVCAHADTRLENVQAVTCLTEGYSGDEICNKCGNEIAKGHAIPATGHNYGEEPFKVINASCTSGKISIYRCDNCHETYSVTDEGEDALGPHTIVEIKEVEPTCDKTGFYVYYCTTCSTNVEVVQIPATGHVDANQDGVCDKVGCGGKVEIPGGSKACSCICHKEGWFMQLIYKIFRFFWKLFGIGKTCDCGFVHY